MSGEQLPEQCDMLRQNSSESFTFRRAYAEREIARRANWSQQIAALPVVRVDALTIVVLAAQMTL